MDRPCVDKEETKNAFVYKEEMEKLCVAKMKLEKSDVDKEKTKKDLGKEAMKKHDGGKAEKPDATEDMMEKQDNKHDKPYALVNLTCPNDIPEFFEINIFDEWISVVDATNTIYLNTSMFNILSVPEIPVKNGLAIPVITTMNLDNNLPWLQ